MKKNILVCTLIFSIKLFSQINVYKPFPEVYGKWVVKEERYAVPSCPPAQTGFKWKRYQAMGDTVVGIYSYKKVYVAKNTGVPVWNGTTYVIPFGPDSFAFGYRNHAPTKRVFYLDCTNGINKDTLWFNFNLNVSNNIQNTYAYDNMGMTSSNPRRTISSIDSMQICGTYYKRYNFNCPSFETSLIQGQGFVDRFFDTNYDGNCPFEPCVVYTTEFFSCFNTDIKQENFIELNISVYPNPSSNQLTIYAPQLQINELSIYDLEGKIVFHQKNANTIDISGLKTNLYLIKLKCKEGEFSQKFIKE